jgi:hypothetical protein
MRANILINVAFASLACSAVSNEIMSSSQHKFNKNIRQFPVIILEEELFVSSLLMAFFASSRLMVFFVR